MLLEYIVLLATPLIRWVELWMVGPRGKGGWGEGTCPVVVKVSIDREAVLALLFLLGLRLAPPPSPPLDQGGVTHAPEEVGLRLQLHLLLPRWPQSGGLVQRRAYKLQKNPTRRAERRLECSP